MSILPSDLLNEICSFLTSSQILFFRFCCKKFYIVLVDIFLKNRRCEQLRECVFSSEPFLPQEIRIRTLNDEKKLFLKSNIFNFVLSGKLIGYIQWNPRFCFWIIYISASKQFLSYFNQNLNNVKDKLTKLGVTLVATQERLTARLNKSTTEGVDNNNNYYSAHDIFWKVWAIIHSY